MTGKLVIPFASQAQANAWLANLAGAKFVEDPVVPAPAPVPIRYGQGSLLGAQQGDFMEMAYEPAGMPNEMKQIDYNRAVAGGIRHFRYPACFSAKADIDGNINAAYADRYFAQVEMGNKALRDAGFPEVGVYDPNHHNYPRKGNSAYFENWPAGILKLTQEQHAARDTRILLQFADRIKNAGLGMSLDVFNEPGGAVTIDGLNAWHADLIPKLRATGGNNAMRQIWLEPVEDYWKQLTIPEGGNVGISPHNYWHHPYTHENAAFSPMALTAFEAKMVMMQAHAKKLGVELYVGEAGVVNWKDSRPTYIAAVCEILKRLGIMTSLWDWSGNFGLCESGGDRPWRPGMLDALAGRLPIPAYGKPTMIDTTKGILIDDSGKTDGKFVDGVLSFGAWDAPWTRPAHVLFPQAPVKSWALFYSENLTCMEFQVRAHVADPKERSGYRLARRLSDGQPIADGYRTQSGVPLETPAMEPGAFLSVTLRQGLGGKGQNVKAVSDRIYGISG
jgi:hypothetical protein